jgi:hypothetical protein
MSSAIDQQNAFIEPILHSHEIARHLRMHRKTVVRQTKQGVIPAHWYNNRWNYRLSEIDAWVSSRLQWQAANLSA